MSELALIPQEQFNIAELSTDVALPETWADFAELLKASGIGMDHASAVLADEWPEVDKAKLVNVPLAIALWTISEPGKGDFDGQYIVVRGMTQTGERFRFADGSTGIFRQLRKLTGERIRDGHPTPNAGLFAPRGLRVSEYEYTDDKGKKSKAQTFYISNEE
jgi:hypothetical protein